MSSNSALTIVQLRPPNLGTANVYGKRMSAPTSPGRATSENSCSVVYWKPTFGSRVATTLQISQTEKPRFSARIDQNRLRRAMRLPVCSQNVSSSGFQSSIQRVVMSCLHQYARQVLNPFRGRTKTVKANDANVDGSLTER